MELKRDGKPCFFYPEYEVDCGSKFETRRCTIGYKYIPSIDNGSGDGFKVATAFHNKKDGPFIKEIGRKLVLERLEKEPDDEYVCIIPMSEIKKRLRKIVFMAIDDDSWFFDTNVLLDLLEGGGLSIFSRSCLNKVIFEVMAETEEEE